jgi:hypothetical protein
METLTLYSNAIMMLLLLVLALLSIFEKETNRNTFRYEKN